MDTDKPMNDEDSFKKQAEQDEIRKELKELDEILKKILQEQANGQYPDIDYSEDRYSREDELLECIVVDNEQAITLLEQLQNPTPKPDDEKKENK